MKRIIIILAITAINISVFSQQIPAFGFSGENNYLINPARAGHTNLTHAFLHYKRQWADIAGSPESIYFAIDGAPKDDKVGVGFSMYNDATNIIARTGGYATYSYRVKINEKHRLAFGLSAGFIQNRVYFEKIIADVPTESTIINTPLNKTTINADFGIGYDFDKLSVNIASFQLLNNSLNYEQEAAFKETKFRLIRHFTGSIQYKAEIDKTNQIAYLPAIYVRSAQGMPAYFEHHSVVKWRDVIWTDLAYKHNSAIGIGLGVVIYDNFIMGYSHDITISEIMSVSGPTNEVMLGYRLYGNKQKPSLKRYENELKKLKRDNQAQFEEKEKLELENEALVKQIATQQNDLKKQKEEIERLKDIYNRDKAEIEKIQKEYEVNINDLSEKNIDSMDTEMMKNRYYVILGAYLRLADAKLFQKILERELGLFTMVFEREDGKYYFVYSKSIDNKDDAKQEFRRLKKLNINQYINGNLWIYKAID